MSSIKTIVAVNVGSSGIKFGLFMPDRSPVEIIKCRINAIGSRKCRLITISPQGQKTIYPLRLKTIEEAALFIKDWLLKHTEKDSVAGIGHRVVHGSTLYGEVEVINEQFLQKIKTIIPLAPLHLPDALTVMRIFNKAFSSVLQIACFDSSFHKHMPFVARYYALPRNLWQKGIIRYGFHGLSCQYIMEYLSTYSDISKSKIVIAHLGSGCSMTAVKNNQSIDTSMGFSPSGGLIMNKRPGDIDPAILIYLLEQKKLKAGAISKLIYEESGLKAIAGTDSSIADLLQKEKTDSRAKEALDIFCYRIKTQIGAMVAALGGLDALVFTGGIGENEASIRERICDNMEALGIRIDKELNDQHAAIISGENYPVTVRVIPTNEEIIIAKEVANLLAVNRKI